MIEGVEGVYGRGRVNIQSENMLHMSVLTLLSPLHPKSTAAPYILTQVRILVEYC